jgi:hypothetical protein
MNTTHQPQQPPTRDPACCGTCAAIVSALTPEQPVKAPGQVQPAPGPQKPVLPRRIEPEDVRVGMLVERRRGECYVGGRVKSIDGSCIKLGAGVVAWTFGGIFGDYGWSLWLIGDAPAPVDDAAVIEAIITAYRRSPECSTHAVFGEAMLDNLRAQGFDVTARAEQ